MDYFLLLAIVYFIYLIASIALFEVKLISPSVVFSASFTFMICLALLFRETLEFRVGMDAFGVLAIAGGIFLFTEFCVKLFYIAAPRKKARHLSGNLASVQNNTNHPIVINRQMRVLLFAFFLLNLVISVAVVGINTTGGSIMERMSQYRQAMLYAPETVRYRFIIAQLYKICSAMIYVEAYIVVYNKMKCAVRLTHMCDYTISILIYCVYTMICQGARQPMIEILVFLVLCVLMMLLKSADKQKVRKLIRRIIPIAVVFVVFFYYAGVWVGRRESERGILEYLAVYFCGGLYSFNLHINEPAKTTFWGQSSFADIYSFLSKLSIVPESAVMSYREFDRYGNTVTLFGRWYEDFGPVGVYVMTFLVAFVFSVMFYNVLTRSAHTYKNHIGRIIYGKFLIALVWAGYDDRIRALLSMQTVVFIVMAHILFYFLVKRKIHFKFR